MFSSEAWLANPGGNLYNGVIGQSLLLSVGSDYKLDRQMVTPTSVTGTICTASWWMKKSAQGTIQSFIQCRDNQASGNYAAYWTYDRNFAGSGDNATFFGESAGGAIRVGTNTTVTPFGDSSAWYHVVIRMDTTQSTASNRIRVYINGVDQIDTYTSDTYEGQNYVNPYWNNAGEHLILFGNGEDSGDSFDGYIAEFNWVDGQSLAPETFGELKNGIWIPKKITLSTSDYGLNGSRYTFADSSDIGKDSSGVGNDLARVANLDATDVVLDSPENNFATFNFLDLRHRAELVQGSLKVQATTYSTSGTGGGNFGFAVGTISLPSSGKFYIEALHSKHAGSGNSSSLGVINRNQADTTGNVGNYFQADTTGGEGFDGIQLSHGSGNSSYFLSRNDGNEEYRVTQDDETNHISALAIDIDNGYIYIGFNAGTDNTGSEITWRDFASNDTGSSNVNPTSAGSGTGGIARTFSLNDVIVSDVATNGNNSNKSSVTINFGQDSSFAGVTSSQGETDANGKGDFYYTVPSGFLALCTSNLPEPTIGPNSATNSTDNFNTILWTGNGGDDRSIGGVGFKPDFVWLKQRNGTNYHTIFDSTRGATKAIYPNAVEDEATNADTLQAFESDGFELGTSGGVNGNNNTFVAWNWKANGGTTSTNDDGDVDSVVQVNATAGFSIVTYTSNNRNDTTVGHGMGIKPDMVFQKNRSADSNWLALHQLVDGTVDYHLLDSTSAGGAASQPASTTSTIATWTSSAGDTTGNLMVAYCFSSIEGYSKLSSYTGNGETGGDGTFVYLGFRPAWLIIKSSAAGEWLLVDNKRNPFNEVDIILNADAGTKEADFETTNRNINFLSNGFKIKSNAAGGTTATNTTGRTYLYMAYAEAPFKYANAR